MPNDRDQAPDPKVDRASTVADNTTGHSPGSEAGVGFASPTAMDGSYRKAIWIQGEEGVPGVGSIGASSWRTSLPSSAESLLAAIPVREASTGANALANIGIPDLLYISKTIWILSARARPLSKLLTVK